ncbi:MAG: GlsB/YeaQ/YmgE family stress response membrane protein [Burkholderiales bacterium]|nr:GlsB/YeaQ/YmgE family stress response membrane protein [Burkholderiales bacterium]MCZ2134514.1 GlsB/YeaQ/YmgE family stress response membrane protein [Burkholderiales bacterium]
MDYIILALVGLVVGAIAKFIVPGKQGGGIIVTAILGMVGSLLGTYGGQQLGIVSMASGTHWIASIVGAVIVVFVYSLLTKKSDGKG